MAAARGGSQSLHVKSLLRDRSACNRGKEGIILTHFRPPLAVDVVGVVALADQTKASISSVDKTIGTALKETLALVAVIVEITCRLVAD